MSKADLCVYEVNNEVAFLRFSLFDFGNRKNATFTVYQQGIRYQF